MVREIIFACVLSFGGFGGLSWSGLPKKAPVLTIVLSLPIGVAIYTFGSALSYSLNVNRPEAGLYVMTAVALAGIYRGLRERKIRFWDIRVFLSSAFMVTMLMIVTKSLVAPMLSYDSYKIIVAGKSFGSSLFSFGSSNLAQFPLMVINLQAGGDLFNLDYVVYLPAVTGLLAIVGATIIISGVVTTSKMHSIVCSLVALLVMAVFWGMTYMLRIQLGYLNSHMLMAGFYTLGFAFCLDIGKKGEKSLDPMLFALIVGSVAFIRLEGLLFVSLLLFALFSCRSFSRKQLLIIGVITLVIPALWYGRLAEAGASGSNIISSRNTVLMLLVAASPFVVTYWRATHRIAKWMPYLVVIGLAGIFSIYMLAQDSAVESSLTLVANSIATGYWGAFWWTFGPLVILMVIFGPRLKSEGVWLEVLGGGILLILLLGMIRSVPYRAGWGDSGNRMLVHLAPLAVMYTLVKVQACFTRDDRVSQNPVRGPSEELQNNYE
tara:strand:+ start:3210 stop:4682 length:1473 start_codon:yes stop_codon:yes gene_type:complete